MLKYVFARKVPGPVRPRPSHISDRWKSLWHDPPTHRKRPSGNDTRLRVPPQARPSVPPIQEYHSNVFPFQAIPTAAKYFSRREFADVRALESPSPHRNQGEIPPEIQRVHPS